jgi:phage-related minor tail protein
MVALNVIRRIQTQATSSGIEETTSKLTALARAQTTVSTTADGMAVKTESSSKRSLSAAGSYDRLKMKMDDTYRTSIQLSKGQEVLNRAFQQGVIDVDQYGRDLQQLNGHFSKAGSANDNFGTSMARNAGLAKHEMVNLGRQASDVAVSLAGGQSPFMVLFTSSNGTVSGFFNQMKTKTAEFLTVGRVAFGGVAVAIAGAGLALNSYLENQTKVQRSLLGAGRASGASIGDINSAANSASSLAGLSVAEARELASALAATGKIGKENLAPIAAIGHDLAVALGTDAKGAADKLASAFADPVKGAQDLNERLGFLDASMERNIANLVAQNRMYDAQQVLLTGVKAGLVGYSDTVSEHTKLWTILGNVISNAWDAAGKYAARGLGLTATLEEKIAAAKKELDELKAGTSNAANVEFAATGLGTGHEPLAPQFDPVKIAEKQAAYDKLIATQDKLSQSANLAAAAQASLAQQTVIRGLAPEIAQREALNNQLKSMENLLDSISNDEAGGARLKQLNLTFAELVKLVEKARGEVTGFRTDFQKMESANKIAMDATTAFSPKARADIAKREAMDRYAQDPNVLKIGQDAYNLSLKQSTVALSEMQRARELSANQAVESADLEIQLVGKSIGQQAEMRANLQAEQTIRQQLSQQHMEWGKAQDEELAMLKRTNRTIQPKGKPQGANDNGQQRETRREAA